MGEACHRPVPDQEPVKGAQGAEAELDGRAAEIVPAQEAKVGAEIIPLQCLPRRRLLPFLLVPAMKFPHRLAVVALRVGRGAPIRSQVLEELLDPLVVDRRLSISGHHFAGLFVVSASRGGKSKVTLPSSSITR